MAYNVMETCMLVSMGLTRSECASWVQAWGSIGAILVAAYGVHWAHRLQRDQREKEQAAEYTQLLESIFQLVGAARAIAEKIGDVQREPHSSSREDRATMIAELEALVDTFRRVDITRLGRYDFIEAIRVADALSRKLISSIQAVEAPGRTPRIEQENLRELADRALETLRERTRRLHEAIAERGGPPWKNPSLPDVDNPPVAH